MRVSIIVPDRTVILDGHAVHGVDLSDLLSEGVHAVQWDGRRGHVEYRAGGVVPLPGPAGYQAVIDRAQQLRATRVADQQAADQAARRRPEHRRALRRAAATEHLDDLVLAVLGDATAKQRVADALAAADAQADADGAPRP